MPKACQMVLFFRETTVFSDEDANLEEICEFTKVGAAWSLKITLKATFRKGSLNLYHEIRSLTVVAERMCP